MTRTWNNDSRDRPENGRDGRCEPCERRSDPAFGGRTATSRLTAAEIPQQKRLEFLYDHQGRRRVKKVYSWDAQAQAWTLERETHFIWLDWLLLETRDVTDNRRTDYILGTDLAGTFQGAGGIGGILCSVTTDSDGNICHQCFLYDFNGNVVNLADPVTGDCTATYEYSPFGKLLISTGPSSDSNPIRFSTKWQDETGLYYYGYRYYDADTGRWIRRDPIAELGAINLYVVCANNLATNTDAVGNSPQLLCCCIMVGLSVWKLYDEVKSATCIGETGVDFFLCLISNLLEPEDIPPLADCIAKAFASETSAKDLIKAIGDCFKSHGKGFLRDIGIYASFLCCAGPSIVSLIKTTPIPKPLPPWPSPAPALGPASVPLASLPNVVVPPHYGIKFDHENNYH